MKGGTVNAVSPFYCSFDDVCVREQDICDKEIKNKKELCYNASDQTNKITGDPSYETYYNRRTETS